LPACLCLSDFEAKAIRTFCERGGTVIADYMPGLWDQHGKGPTKGSVLDDLFGVQHDPSVFAPSLPWEKAVAPVKIQSKQHELRVTASFFIS